MEEKILNSIKKALNELIISFFNKEISDDEVLKALNKAIHYNSAYTPYIYEMFFIQALELDKVPKNKYLLSGLFSIASEEDRLMKEDIRIKVLKKLGLNKTLEIYENFLISQDDDAHTHFPKESLERYEKTNKKSMQDFKETLLEEL